MVKSFNARQGNVGEKTMKTLTVYHHCTNQYDQIEAREIEFLEQLTLFSGTQSLPYCPKCNQILNTRDFEYFILALMNGLL